MNAYIKNRRIIIKNTCSAFTNMNIPIKDNNFFYTRLFLCNPRSNSSIIKKAEASSCYPMGMMTRRSNDCKSGVNLILANCFNSFDSTTRCYKSTLTCKLILISIISKLSNILFLFELNIVFLICTAFLNRLNMFLTVYKK